MKTIITDDIRTLREFHSIGYTSAIIAGGAVRDVYFNRPPNDIDIFIWDNEFSSETIDPAYQTINTDSLKKLFNLTDRHDEVTRLGNGEYNRVKHIAGVWEMWVNKLEVKYQIIVLKTHPIYYVKTHFDIGLCMCYCDGVKLSYTDAFLTDATNKTITICGDLTLNEYMYSVKHHVNKIKYYFPDFTVVDLLKGKYLKN